MSLATPAVPSITETILVVDDDMAVRSITMRTLRLRGYEVLGAADGKSALDLSASYDGVIDLVLSDAMMPGMNGSEVVEGLRRGRPALKVVIMSGFGRGDAVDDAGAATPVGFVQKPFSFEALVRAVREQLDG